MPDALMSIHLFSTAKSSFIEAIKKKGNYKLCFLSFYGTDDVTRCLTTDDAVDEMSKRKQFRYLLKKEDFNFCEIIWLIICDFLQTFGPLLLDAHFVSVLSGSGNASLSRHHQQKREILTDTNRNETWWKGKKRQKGSFWKMNREKGQDGSS